MAVSGSHLRLTQVWIGRVDRPGAAGKEMEDLVARLALENGLLPYLEKARSSSPSGT